MYWYREAQTQDYSDYYAKKKAFFPRLKRTLAIYAFLGFFGFLVYFFIAGINYMDVGNYCFIGIKSDVVLGNKESIVEAIKRIKTEDYITYKNLCRYANTIYERDCLLADNDTPSVYEATTDGCYIKGSKAIFIAPNDKYSEELIETRKELIIEYTQISTDFWHSKKQ